MKKIKDDYTLSDGDHELAAQISYEDMVAQHANDDPANDINFNGLTKQDKEKNKKIHKQVEALQKKLQKQIDIDCGRTNLPSYKKEVKSILTFDKESLKELLREHLTVQVETKSESYSSHWDGSDGHSFLTKVSILFDNEVITDGYDTTTT